MTDNLLFFDFISNSRYIRYKNLKIIDSRLNGLVEMIHHYGRVYEQEGYIEKCAY